MTTSTTKLFILMMVVFLVFIVRCFGQQCLPRNKAINRSMCVRASDTKAYSKSIFHKASHKPRVLM